jgi:hypothetical protein
MIICLPLLEPYSNVFVPVLQLVQSIKMKKSLNVFSMSLLSVENLFAMIVHNSKMQALHKSTSYSSF